MCTLDHPGRAGAICALAALLTLAGMPTAGSAQETGIGPPSADADAGLEPGDLVRLRVWREPNLSGEYLVDEGGSVVLPLLGPVKATGMPASALKTELAERYAAEFRNDDAEIFLMRRVRVLGYVNAPGLYHVDRTMTLGDAIALAGGVSSDGKTDGIRIVRDGELVRSDLDSSVPVADQIQSGDQIMVEQRSWFARNAGLLLGATISSLGFLIGQAF